MYDLVRHASVGWVRWNRSASSCSGVFECWATPQVGPQQKTSAQLPQICPAVLQCFSIGTGPTRAVFEAEGDMRGGTDNRGTDPRKPCSSIAGVPGRAGKMAPSLILVRDADASPPFLRAAFSGSGCLKSRMSVSDGSATAMGSR